MAAAAALGYTCTPSGPDQAEGDPVEAFMHMQCSFGELVRAIADPLARMKADPVKMVTPSEMRRADHAGAAHHATVDGALAALRGHTRPRRQRMRHEHPPPHLPLFWARVSRSGITVAGGVGPSATGLSGSRSSLSLR